MDDALRSLERRFAASGARADEVAYLNACLQAGHLTRQRLELAASLGHEAATDALGGPPQARTLMGQPMPLHPDRTEWADWRREWTTRLGRDFGLEGAGRAGVALLRPRLRVDPDPRLLGVLATVEAWLLDPGDERLETVRSALQAIESWYRAALEPYRDLLERAREEDAAYWEQTRVHGPMAVRAPSQRARIDVERTLRQLSETTDAGLALRQLVRAIVAGQGVSSVVREALSAKDRLEPLRAELVPWALGYADPVQSGAQERQES